MHIYIIIPLLCLLVNANYAKEIKSKLEDIADSVWNESKFIEAISNSKEMNKYLENTNKQDIIENPFRDSYISAYNMQQNGYQGDEEVSENGKRIRKRSAPELIKFELSDAKEPDEKTKEFFRHQREQRQMRKNVEPTVTRLTKVNDSQPKKSLALPKKDTRINDQTSSETRVSKSVHSVKQVYPMDKLPIGVQKVIEMVLHDKNIFKDPIQHQFSTPMSAQKLSHHNDKLPKLFAKAQEATFKAEQYLKEKSKYVFANVDAAQEQQSEHLEYSHFVPSQPESMGHDEQSASQEPIAEPVQDMRLQTEPVETVNILPKVKYIFTEVPTLVEPTVESIMYHPVQNVEATHNNYPVPVVPIATEPHFHGIQFANLGEFEKQIIQEHNLFQGSNEILQGKNIQSQQEGYNALTSLIGKAPTDQLQGLKYLLTKQVEQKEQDNRPQDNTAPIMFPSKVSAERNIPKATQSTIIDNYHRYKAIAESSAGDAYAAKKKTYTPVTETPVEATKPTYFSHNDHISPVISINPPSHPLTPPTSYKDVNGAGLIGNYEEMSHDGKGYAAGYAFGYRVRDFHTGNDFGHTQNRDTDGITRGEYHILLPDGRVQNVRYHADDSGFHADVSFEAL